jgi:hypothetical protein
VPADTDNNDDLNPISRVIKPSGPGFDPRAKAGGAPASADHRATAAAAGRDDSGQVSPNKARTLVVGPPMPVVSSKASDGGAGKRPPGAIPAVPPSATGGGAAEVSSDAPSGETQMDAIINNEGLSIPVNVDPLATSGGANNAAADASAVPVRGSSPEPSGCRQAMPAALPPHRTTARQSPTMRRRRPLPRRGCHSHGPGPRSSRTRQASRCPTRPP